MTSEQIDALIQQLLKTGEILATKGYELALRQVMIYGWEYIIAAILLTVLAVMLWHLMFTENEGFLGVLAVAVHGLQVALIFSGVERLLNPSWFAVKLLIDTFLK